MSDALVYNAGLVDPEATEPTEPGTLGRTAKQQFFRALGHCACDVHGGPTCATCRKHYAKVRALKACGCGRLLRRPTDAVCPKCEREASC